MAPHLFVVAVALVALTGCTTAPTPAPPSRPATTPTPPDADRAAWQAWRPTTSVTLPVLTEEEAQRRIKESVADVAKLHNTPVDSLPAPVRVVSPVEWTAVIAQCCTDGDFPTTVEPDGTSSSYIPPGQEEAEERVDTDCRAKYPVDPRFTDQPTPSMLDAAWEYYDAFLIPCLRRHDREPTVPLPTRETFREHPTWNGYPDNLPRAQREQLNWQCPASPPFEALGA